MVRGAPASVKPQDAEPVLREMIEELVDISVAKHLLVRPDQVMITASCKMAIKAGDAIGHAEMEKLIQDLAKTENPYLCPHGRPITIVMPKSDMMRKFKR